MDCIQIEVNVECNCSLPIDDGWLKEKYSIHCKVEKIRDCRNKAMEKRNRTLAQCRNKCLPPCQYWSYSYSVSYIGFNEVKKGMLWLSICSCNGIGIGIIRVQAGYATMVFYL